MTSYPVYRGRFWEKSYLSVLVCFYVVNENDLHWLPVKLRIQYKVMLLVHKALYSISPDEINNLLVFESARTFNLQIQRSNSTFGDRAFSIYSAKLWNTLPLGLKTETVTTQFKKRLKTHLFTSHFISNWFNRYLYVWTIRQLEHSCAQLIVPTFTVCSKLEVVLKHYLLLLSDKCIGWQAVWCHQHWNSCLAFSICLITPWHPLNVCDSVSPPKKAKITYHTTHFTEYNT